MCSGKYGYRFLSSVYRQASDNNLLFIGLTLFVTGQLTAVTVKYSSVKLEYGIGLFTKTINRVLVNHVLPVVSMILYVKTGLSGFSL